MREAAVQDLALKHSPQPESIVWVEDRLPHQGQLISCEIHPKKMVSVYKCLVIITDKGYFQHKK